MKSLGISMVLAAALVAAGCSDAGVGDGGADGAGVQSDASGGAGTGDEDASGSASAEPDAVVAGKDTDEPEPDEDDAGAGPEDAAEAGPDGVEDVEEPLDDVDEATVCGEGEPCDDGDGCTEDDVCGAEGGCAGTPVACDDGKICTDDLCQGGGCTFELQPGYCLEDDGSCATHGTGKVDDECLVCDANAEGGAAFAPVEDGKECDDGDACSETDVCAGGECVMDTALACPPAPGPCAETLCDWQQGCVLIAKEGPCQDGDPCTVGDTCDTGICEAGPETPDCDDEDACTVDVCAPGVGCVSEAPAGQCDDDDLCTVDSCDAASGDCTHEATTGACDDGDPCTSGETCATGTCEGGVTFDCDDDNVCTDDACVEGEGCSHLFITPAGGCDDGIDCTIEDECVAGLCIGKKTDICTDCPGPKSDDGSKVTVLKFNPNGHVGSGVDVDEDPETCAPAADCSEGIDNALGVLAELLNDPMSEALDDGAMMWVLDFGEMVEEGVPFPLSVYDTELSWDSWLDGCEYQTATCGYTATQFSFDGDCSVYFGVSNAVVQGGVLTGGGQGHQMTMAFALGNGVFIPLQVLDAQVTGTVAWGTGPDGEPAIFADGLFAGATPTAELFETFLELPDSLFPFDKEAAVALLEQIVEKDIDADGDGIYESASVGVRFKSIGAVLE